MEKNMDKQLSTQTVYQQHSIKDLQTMAQAVAESGLFGIKTAKEAMGLMLVAQAEGRHPALVARDYHIVNGKPALKADAMLARFQEAGGKIEWLQLDDTKAEAKFIHPQGNATISWDMARMQKAELGKNGMWKKYPRQMLRSRVISEGIRTVLPGCICGVYEVEEIRDMDIKDITNESTVISKDLTNGNKPTGHYKKYVEEQKALEASTGHDYTDFYNKMELCESAEQLATIFNQAQREMSKNGDNKELTKLIALKDELKNKLIVTAADNEDLNLDDYYHSVESCESIEQLNSLYEKVHLQILKSTLSDNDKRQEVKKLNAAKKIVEAKIASTEAIDPMTPDDKFNYNCNKIKLCQNLIELKKSYEAAYIAILKDNFEEGAKTERLKTLSELRSNIEDKIAKENEELLKEVKE
jgi:hypothetical protein